MSRFQTFSHIVTHARGGANLLELGSILARGQDEGVTPRQFRAMHPTLLALSDEQISAAATFSKLAFSGEIYAGKLRHAPEGPGETGGAPA